MTVRRTRPGAVRLVAVAACLVAALTGAGPVGAQDAAPRPAGAAEPPAPAATFDPALRAALGAAGPRATISVIVILVQQLDVTALGDGGDHPGRRVVNRLRGLADTTQAGLRGVLAQRRQQGTVERFVPLWIINGLAVTARPAVIWELASRPEVASVELDATVPGPGAASSATVATVAEQNLEAVNASELWALGYQGSGVVVANMDTGVDGTHPDLASRWRGGTNSWYDPHGQHPTSPVDVSGHGTMTMGIMVGGDAGGTAVGVAPDATVDRSQALQRSGLHHPLRDPPELPVVARPRRQPGHRRCARRGERLVDLLVSRVLPHVPARRPGPQGCRRPARVRRRQLGPGPGHQPQPGELPRVVRGGGHRQRRPDRRRQQPGRRRLRWVIGHLPRPRRPGRQRPEHRHVRPLRRRVRHLVLRAPRRRRARPRARRLPVVDARRAGCRPACRRGRPRHARSRQHLRVRAARRARRLPVLDRRPDGRDRRCGVRGSRRQRHPGRRRAGPGRGHRDAERPRGRRPAGHRRRRHRRASR